MSDKPVEKGVPFVWTELTQTAFVQLKTALINAPVLAIPDFSKPFVLETDARDLGFRVVLIQEGHPMAFLSRLSRIKLCQLMKRNAWLSSLLWISGAPIYSMQNLLSGLIIRVFCI